jgi:hypothetical protein
MKQSKSLDNQQRSIEERLCWLGGIIDGEGCITAMAGHTKTGHGHLYKYRRFVPLISIVNTDKTMVDEIVDILTTVEIGHWVSYRESFTKHPTWKAKWEIMISGMKRCQKAAEVLVPYLVSKKSRLLLLKTWVDRRLCLATKAEYTEDDYRLLNLIRASSLPLRGHTSVTVNNTVEDMVQTT